MINDIWNNVILNYPELVCCTDEFNKACDMLISCYKAQGKVLVCGNGGSASDAEHIVGELMKGFKLKRKLEKDHIDKIENCNYEDAQYLCDNLQQALPAISLCGHCALSTAFSNDVAGDMVFAQQVFGFGKQGDVLIGLSTSGNSKNVVNAIKIANAFGIKTIGFTGATGGKMATLCDITIKVPSTETYRIQEYHLPVYHALCEYLEKYFYDK